MLEILLVVTAIIILAAIVVVAINPVRQIAQTHNAQRESNINAILNATYQYSVDNKGATPPGITQNLQMIGTSLTGCNVACGQSVASLSDSAPRHTALASIFDQFIHPALAYSGKKDAVPGAKPVFVSAQATPGKVLPGDTMSLAAHLTDPAGITEVRVDMGGIETLSLALTDGTATDGTWTGKWLVHDTGMRQYMSTFTAKNAEGASTVDYAPWSDPPASGWVSPSSTVDAGAQWSNYANMRDNNLTTYGSNNYGGTGYGQFIEFDLAAPIYSNRVRVNADYLDVHIANVDVDVFVDGAWVDVFTGGNEAQWNDQYVELPFTGGTVTKARFRYNYSVGGFFYWLYEFQFYQTVPVVTLPSVTTQSADLIQDVAANLHGTLDDDGGEPNEYRFQYGLTTSYGTDTSWTSSVSTGDNFNQFVPGLTPLTTYHFRAQARNSAGTTSGADQTFTTQPPLTGWVSPSGFSDPTNTWENEINATDQSLSSYARSYHNMNATQWSEFVYYTHDDIISSKLRFYARGGAEVDQVDVDVYKDGAWVDVYQGAFTDQQYVEETFTQGVVGQIRIRFHATAANQGFFWQLFEVFFEKTSEGTSAACLDLPDLIPDYIASMPYDPTTGSPAQTYYAIKKSANNRVTVYSCTPELNKVISVTR